MCARCDTDLASSWTAVPRSGALAVVGIATALALLAVQLHGELLDLRVYRMAGAAALTGHDALYRLADPASGLPFTYPPFAALLFAPLATIGRRPAEVLLTVGSVLALARICLLLQVGRVPARRPAVFALAAVCEPVLSTVLLGQINLLLMALVLTTMLVPRSSGCWLGVAAGIKLTPAVFLVGLWFIGRRREALQGAVTAACTVVVGAIALPRSSWTFWTGTGFDPTRVGGVAYISNQSLNGALWRLAGHGGSGPWWVLLSAATVAVGYRALLVQQRSGTPLAASQSWRWSDCWYRRCRGRITGCGRSWSSPPCSHLGTERCRSADGSSSSVGWWHWAVGSSGGPRTATIRSTAPICCSSSPVRRMCCWRW